MRVGHFEALRPLCPVCRQRPDADAAAEPLELVETLAERSGHVLEGLLRCPSAGCASEFPIVDGIPVIVPNLRELVAGQIDQIQRRDDLSETLESVLGDCCGPSSAYETVRQQLSSYGWTHWGDLEPAADGAEAGAGDLPRLVGRSLELAGAAPDAPTLDLGCAAGRATFELAARGSGLALGVDLNIALLRVAGRALREGVVRYPLRQVGLVYERRELAVQPPAAERVDFWACDSRTLPFADGTFGSVSGFNLLDSVAGPLETLGEALRALTVGGKLLLSSPYDWSPSAVAVESWLGGHSQRGPEGGASEPVLRALLTPGGHPASFAGARVIGEEERIPWRVRLHARSTVDYRVHLLAAEKTA